MATRAPTSKSAATSGGAAAAASTVPAAVSALEDKGALQYRLALGAATGTASATTKRGGRGTLTRSAQYLLVDLLRAPPTPRENKNNSSTVSPRDAARELRLLQIEMNKMVLVLNRIQRETQQLNDDDDEQGREREAASSNGTDGRDDFKSLSVRVHDLRRQVNTAQQAQACQAEYEALASLLHRRHAVPSSVLQSQIDAIDRQADAATRDLRHKQESLKVRTAQVSALVQSILDLKQSLLLASEGGGDASSDSPGTLAASAPSSSLAEARSLGASRVPAKKRRRNDSDGGDDSAAGAAADSSRAGIRADALTLDEPIDMEEGEESNDNDNSAMSDSADDRKGTDGPEEELYGDL
jgi:hypothetical protein